MSNWTASSLTASAHMAHQEYQPPLFHDQGAAGYGGLGSLGILPPEVRMMIYNFLCGDDGDQSGLPLTYYLRHIINADGLLKMLHVSKELREEILGLLNKQNATFARTLDFGRRYFDEDLGAILLDNNTADLIQNFQFSINMDSMKANVFPNFAGPWDKRECFEEAVLAFNHLARDTILQASRPGPNRGKILFEFHNVHRGMCGFMLSSHLLKYLAYLVHFQEVRFRFTVRECRRFQCCPRLSDDKSLAIAVMKQLGDSLKPHLGIGRRRVTRIPSKRGHGIVDHVVYIFWPQEHKKKLEANPKPESKSRAKALPVRRVLSS